MKRRGVPIVAVCHAGMYGTYSAALREAMERVANADVLLFASAGNMTLNMDQTSVHLPGFNTRTFISVAATLENDGLANWSNWGRDSIHLAAPGDSIRTTLGTNIWGTSYAQPMVVGAAALIKATFPQASALEIKAAILGSVDQPASLQSRVISNGRLNVAKALARMTNAAAPTIVVTTTPTGSRTLPNDPLEVIFSRPMDRQSTERALGIEPAVEGAATWDDAGRILRFVPMHPWVRTNHTIGILGSAKDSTGQMIDGNFNGVRQGSPADDFRWSFNFPPPNDDFNNRLPLEGSAGSVQGTTRNALSELHEPKHAGNVRSATSVWYEWLASTNGWYTIRTSRNLLEWTSLRISSESFLTLPELMNDGPPRFYRLQPRRMEGDEPRQGISTGITRLPCLR